MALVGGPYPYGHGECNATTDEIGCLAAQQRSKSELCLFLLACTNCVCVALSGIPYSLPWGVMLGFYRQRVNHPSGRVSRYFASQRQCISVQDQNLPLPQRVPYLYLPNASDITASPSHRSLWHKRLKILSKLPQPLWSSAECFSLHPLGGLALKKRDKGPAAAE